MDRYRLSAGLHRGHARGGPHRRRLRLLPHLQGVAGGVHRRDMPGGGGSQLRVDCRGQGRAGRGRRGHGAYRDGHRRRVFAATSARDGPGRGGRVGRGRVDAGSGLRRGNRRVAGLAVDILAQRAAGGGVVPGSAVAAQPFRSRDGFRGPGGLPGRVPAGGGAAGAVPGVVAAKPVPANIAIPVPGHGGRTGAAGGLGPAGVADTAPALGPCDVPLPGFRVGQRGAASWWERRWWWRW